MAETTGRAAQAAEDAAAPAVIAAMRASGAPMLLTGGEPEETIRFANEAFLALSGYRLEELVGKPRRLLDEVAGEAAELLRQAARRREAAAAPVELRQRRRDGSPFRAAVYPSVVHDSAGDHSLLTFLHLASRAEVGASALGEGERRYRSLFDRIDDGFCIIEMIFEGERPVDYRFLEVNAAFEAQTGLTDATGRTMRTLRPAHEEHWFERYGRIARSRQAERFELPAVELGFHYEVFAFPVGEPEEERVGVLFRDVSERLRSESLLRASEARFRTLTELSPDGILINSGNRLAYANPSAAQIYGVETPEEMLGLVPLEIVAPEYRRETRARMDAVLEGATVPSTTLELIRADGSRVTVDVKAAPVAWDGKPAIQVLWRDASERRQAESRQGFLLGVGDTLRTLTDPAAIEVAVTALLGRHLESARAYYCAVDERGGTASVLQDYAGKGTASLAGSYDLGDFPGMMQQLRQGRTLVVPEMRQAPLPTAEQDRLLALSLRSLIAVPLVKQGRLVAVFTAGDLQRRNWTEAETGLVEEVASRTWAAIERGRAEAALRDSEERYRLIVENATDYAIFTTDPAGLVTDWQAGAEAVFGYAADEIIGRDCALLYTPEDRDSGQPARELRIAAQRGSAPNVRWHLRKDDGRVFIQGSVMALRSADGGLRGFLKIGQDVTARRAVDEALRESRRQQRALIEGIPQLVWRSGEGGRWTWSSPQWSAYTGLSEPESRELGWLEALHPEDRAAAEAAWAVADREGPLDMETRLFNRQEGRYRWFRTRATPLRDEAGRLVEWLGTSTDIDDLRRLQDQQKVMVAELQHRTRNLIAVVQSIAHQTLRNSDSLDDFRGRFSDRLVALSRIQGLLSRSELRAITIGDLVRMEIEALGAGPEAAGADGRVSLSGPEVPLRNAVVQTLSLALHELATNARKYGVLSGETGSLTIRWRLAEGADSSPLLELEWLEQGIVPRQAARPGSGGYGRTLIERALPYSLGATTEYDLGETALRCAIRLPLAAPKREEA